MYHDILINFYYYRYIMIIFQRLPSFGSESMSSLGMYLGDVGLIFKSYAHDFFDRRNALLQFFQAAHA
jgi:hypothetical protein